MLASSKSIHCFSSLSRKLDAGWPERRKVLGFPSKLLENQDLQVHCTVCVRELVYFESGGTGRRAEGNLHNKLPNAVQLRPEGQK